MSDLSIDFDAEHKMMELRKQWIHCEKCKLCETRNKVVFGNGNPEADILIIGEAPGLEEDRSGIPFKGPAGETLDELLRNVKLDRVRDVFVTNVVACRPTVDEKDEKGQIQTIDRPPTKLERESCFDRLLEIIYIVDPLLIVTVGKVPAAVLLGQIPAMGNLRGIVRTYKLEGRHRTLYYPIMPIYHTAYLRRSSNKTENGPWIQTATDILQICNIIDHLREVYYGETPPVRE